MFTFNRLNAVALAVCLALSGGLYFSVRHSAQLGAELKVSQEATKQAQAATKRIQATSVLREKTRAVTAQYDAKSRHSVQVSIESAPEWAKEAVPKAVQDALME